MSSAVSFSLVQLAIVRNRALRKQSSQGVIPVYEQTDSRTSAILIFKLFIIINLADRAAYIFFISLSRNVTEINT